jgi:hypothetical protein
VLGQMDCVCGEAFLTLRREGTGSMGVRPRGRGRLGPAHPFQSASTSGCRCGEQPLHHRRNNSRVGRDL